MARWDWYFDLAERCVKEAKGDGDLALEMMVSECLKGIPRWVLEEEFWAYIEATLHKDEIEEMEPEEIIQQALEASRARQRSN
jgi:hypothetical protein